MKKILKIDEQLNDVNMEAMSDKEKVNLPTYRKLLVAACGLFFTTDPASAIDYFAIGKKIKDAKTDLILEDAEIDKLGLALDKNPSRLPVVFFAQLVLKFRGAEVVKLEVK